MPITVEQQKRLIRYLINLDCADDPAWDAIKSRSDSIFAKIKLLHSHHKSERNEWNKSKTNTPNSKYSKYNAPPPVDIGQVPANVNFIDEICLSISETFPDLWKIGQAYFSGELQVKVEPGRHVEFKVSVANLLDTKKIAPH